MNVLTNKWLQISTLALTTLILYGHTLDVPYYLDDYTSVVENPVIRSLDLGAIWKYTQLRFMSSLSFAVNYSIHGLEPAGYHITNILIHFSAGLAAFFLCHGIIKTPALKESNSEPFISWLPFAAALLFLLHPLQTQAITYIVQRMASLAAAFYLASLASYVWARLHSSRIVQLCLLITCGGFAIMAFFSKQNTITLPLTILITEIFLFRTKAKKLIPFFLIAAAILAGFWLLCSLLLHYDPVSLTTLDRLTKATDSISRGDYFINQTLLLWRYIALYFLPQGLHLDYFIPYHTTITPAIMTAMTAHVLVLAFAVALFRRLPLIAFALVFYYLTHLIESGLVPLPDLFFEHRAYLPNFGLCLIAGWLLTVTLPKYLNPKIAIGITAVLFLSLGTITWQRNNIWRTPLAFWSDCVKEEPENYRALGELGKHLLIEQRYNEAFTMLDRSLKAQAKYRLPFKSNQAVAVNMALILQQLKDNDTALRYINSIIDQDLESYNLAKLLTARGKILLVQEKWDEAENSFVKALDLDRTNSFNYVTLSNLGVIYAMQERLAEAEKMFEESLRLQPGYKSAAENLQNLYKLKKEQGHRNYEKPIR